MTGMWFWFLTWVHIKNFLISHQVICWDSQWHCMAWFSYQVAWNIPLYNSFCFEYHLCFFSSYALWVTPLLMQITEGLYYCCEIGPLSYATKLPLISISEIHLWLMCIYRCWWGVWDHSCGESDLLFSSLNNLSGQWGMYRDLSWEQGKIWEIWNLLRCNLF